ncbi:MAG TPA: nitroreductase family protein [Candidatus Lokiarchaeia archaeon]|nr:nitroreductase family protein [Candidatus Lokiarchaeia archaeon]
MVESSELLQLIKDRESARAPFDVDRPLAMEDLRTILEAARWAPTAHNMQNFEVVVVDDPALMDEIGAIKSGISIEFLQENYEQLSFSVDELQEKKTGILGFMFPPSWKDPDQFEDLVRNTEPAPIGQRVGGCPVLLVVAYDSRKRAPASEGDVLGFMSLGCMMENLWLQAQSLGIGVQILASLAAPHVASEIQRILGIPEHMTIAFGIRLGYPAEGSYPYVRVRREVDEFTHHNGYQNMGLE